MEQREGKGGRFKKRQGGCQGEGTEKESGGGK